MTTINARIGRLLAGIGGVLLLASLFLTWADYDGGASPTGWQFSNTLDVFLAIVAVHGIAAAVSGGRFGYFRPDVSVNGAADIFGVLAATVLAWLLIFDFPQHASPGVGAYLALAGTLVIATGAGDFKVKSLFPRLPD